MILFWIGMALIICAFILHLLRQWHLGWSCQVLGSGLVTLHWFLQGFGTGAVFMGCWTLASVICWPVLTVLYQRAEDKAESRECDCPRCGCDTAEESAA